MRFYDRKNELSLLAETKAMSLNSARMTVVVGRRRIGKTSLVLKSCEGSDYIYFFVARKNESLLCKDFIDEIEVKLKTPLFGEIKSFSKLFEYLMVQSQSRAFTLVVDEVQEFFHINPSVFSDIQNIWDKYKQSSKMNLIFSGSAYSMMKKIFENENEPLFGRSNERIHLQPFTIDVLIKIVTDHYPAFKPKDLLGFYIITGGVAKYVEHFADKNLFTVKKMLNEIFRDNSLLLEEGKNILIEEFGRDYTTYFSILSLIASSKTSRTDIESILEKDIGGYLARLEKDYSIIKSVRPLLAKPNARVQKYFIEDNFLNFWFRFVYKYRNAIEIGNYKYVNDIVERDFNTYSSHFLEKYFIEKLALTKQYSLIGNYWERRNKNEIDIVAINEKEKKVVIGEVKLNSANINLRQLKEKSINLIRHFTDYEIEFVGLSLSDMF